MREMRLSNRLVLLIYALLVLALSLLAAALLLGWRIPPVFQVAFRQDSANLWGTLAALLFVTVISCYLIAVALRHHRTDEVVIQETGLGSVEVTSQALEELIKRATRQVRDVRGVRPVLNSDQEGLSVALYLNLNPDCNFPEVTRQVQEGVQSYLEEKSGVRVRQVRVLVESVSLEARSRVE